MLLLLFKNLIQIIKKMIITGSNNAEIELKPSDKIPYNEIKINANLILLSS